MFNFLTVAEGDILIAAVALTLGVVFSTKITDFFKGVPSDMRSALTDVETDALAKFKAAKAVKPVAVKKAVSPAAALVASAAASVAGATAVAPTGPTGPTGA